MYTNIGPPKLRFLCQTMVKKTSRQNTTLRTELFYFLFFVYANVFGYFQYACNSSVLLSFKFNCAFVRILFAYCNIVHCIVVHL